MTSSPFEANPNAMAGNNRQLESNSQDLSMRPSPELSIIFVNWRSLDYLRESLKSILTTTVGIDYEIVVVDNASPGAEAARLQAEFPNVTVIEAGENLGFARANNLGFLNSSGKYILFLNPDTKVIGPAVETMLANMKELPGAAIVGCRLLNGDGFVQTSCIQRFPTILNQLLDIDFLRARFPGWKIWGIAPLYSDLLEPSEVEVISGACLMIERQTFEEVGMFSQEFFMYAEDVDLCYRVRMLGRKVYYTGGASVIHYGGASSGRKEVSQWAATMQRQAILQFLRNTRGSVYARAYRASMGIAAIGRLAAFGLLAPFHRRATEKGLILTAPAKWVAVLKWAVGFSRADS